MGIANSGRIHIKRLSEFDYEIIMFLMRICVLLRIRSWMDNWHVFDEQTWGFYVCLN